MTHRGPCQPLLFCDSVTLCHHPAPCRDSFQLCMAPWCSRGNVPPDTGRPTASVAGGGTCPVLPYVPAAFTAPARGTAVPGDPVGHGMSTPQRRGSPLTCQGLVTKKPGNLLLAELLLFVGQQLVDKLPNDLLGRCVQHRVHIHNESVNGPAKSEREGRAVSASPRHSPATPIPGARGSPACLRPGVRAGVPGCERGASPWGSGAAQLLLTGRANSWGLAAPGDWQQV